MMGDIRDEVQVTIDRQLNSKKSKMISEKFNQVVEGVPEECRSIQYERQSLQSMGERATIPVGVLSCPRS